MRDEDEGGAPAGPEGRPWLAFVAMAVPLLALSMDINGVGMLLPSIQDDLGASPATIGWVANTTVLTFAALLLPVGRISPRLGDRRLVLTGIFLFGVASVLCGLAPTFPLLIAARVAQGLGGVLTFTTSLAVINRTFDPARRPAAIGAWGVVNGVGGAVGPLVSGALTSAWSWRAFFLVNVPLCLGALPAIRAFTTADPPPPADPERVPWGRLAVVGVAVVALTVGFQAAAGDGWLAPLPVGGVSLGVVLLAGLVVSGRRGATPVVSAAVRGGTLFRSASIVGTSANWGFGVTIVFMGVYLQDVMGLEPVHAGVVFTAFSAAGAVAGLLIARLVRLLGVRRAMQVALVVVAVPLVAAVALTAQTALPVVVLGLSVAGFGQGLAFNLSTLAALEGVPDDAGAEASGVLATIRSLGFTIGVAVSTTVSLRVSGDGGPGLTAGIDAVLVLAAGVALTGLVAASLTERPVGDRSDAHR